MRRGANSLYYLLGDHLGSQAITADGSGGKISEVRYYPWGGDRYYAYTSTTTFRFTGQRTEFGLGLYYYGARWYDQAAGRFISADIVVPSHNQDTENSKRIQIMLIVDYHELSLLAELGEMYRSDLLKIEQDLEKSGKPELLNPNQKQDNHKVTDNSNNVYQPLADINQSSSLGRQQNNPRQEDEGKNNENNLVDMMPTRLNSMGFDRYAYTSNCPTKYTDPSGHCDMAKAIGSGVVTFLGVWIFGFGLGVFIIGMGEVGTTAPTIVGPFIGMHEMGVGGLMAYAGYITARKGVEGIINSDCIPGLESGK